MAKVITNPIPDLQTSWENYSGESVENFIKDQLKRSCGYIWRSPSKEGDYYYLYGFQSVEDFEKWRDGEEVEVLFKVQLPNLENDTFSANLTTNSNTTKLVNLGSGVKVNLRYTSTSTNPTTGVTVNTYNEGTLVIMRAANGSAYLEVGRETIQPVDFADESLYTQIDVTKYLVDGDNKLRIRVEDKVNGAISTNVIFNSIINTTLKVSNATDLSKPLTSMTLQYYIEGQVAKTLNIKISDTDGVHNYTLPIGESTYLEVPFTAIIDGNFKNGVKNVESWLTVDDTVLESDHITVQFYYINGQSDEGVIILNNVAKEVANYANTHFFDFTLYNKNSDVEITVASGSETYLTYRYTNCLVNTVYSFYNTLEIEATPDYLDAVVTVRTIDHTESYNITIDNSQKMSPTEGANFILNPKSRSNTEANPGTIINEGTDTNEITSTFTGFDFVNDGWASDASGIRVLRIPAGHEVKIGYHPLDMAKLSGTTIELDFRVYNVFNESDTVLKFVDTNDSGFIMNATEAVYYTYENRIKRDQDIVFQDDTRLHVAINIVPNLSGSGINYIRIFINGTLNREMIYENTDLFIQNIENMVIGAPNCDIDIYSIRVYKKGLSAEDVRQDYMSTLPTLEEKIAYRTYNDIVSSNGTISFDKASVKYNTLVWTGKHPEYITGKVKYRGDLSINIIDDLEHSGVLKNMEISGQGSSSRDYWRWNHQYVFKDNSTWINGLGEDMGKYYILSDEDPRCTKLVSKINWASSMQSHKMGTTALYTDLWRKIIGGNSISKTKGYEKTRVSVHEKPFLYFFKDTENSNPVFGGLVTFGSAKGDESTFAGSYTTFPNYLMLEGSDNGMPLPLRLVPWIDSEVSYDAEEDTWNYNGAANWDYVAGNVNRVNYFKDAFNFAYLHSQYLLPYTGTDMNIDYQYWDPTTGRVIRYDYITENWVDAGITKTSSGYSELNIFEQTGISRGSDSDSVLNEKFKKWRADDFKNRLSLYYNVSDTLYTIAFLKLIAGSDNRCKNTYEYLDPNTLKICFAQDDMDTIFATDNVGRKVKPYYVEEHDMNGTSTYWNGENNVFYNLIEAAYGTELRAMMKSILDTMRSSEFGGSVKECMNRYFFSTQDYFPSVAYNETARILYEEASVKQKEGIYKNGTPAISQSLGDQKQAEMQWWKRREKYMQSYASSDPFYIRSAGSLFFRSLLTTQSARPSYQFKLTPWQWLYPKVGSGQSMGSDNTRVQGGTEYTTSTITTDGNTDTFIYGIDYYTKIGEFGDKSIGEAFELSGNRLLEFSADSRKVSSYQFRPTSMTVSCPVLERLCLYGCSTLAGSINLSSCKKLQSLDLRGTNLASVVLPETETLREVYLPETITTLTVNNCPNLDVNITDYSRLTTVNTDNSNFAMKVIQNANNIETVSFNGINIRTTVQNYQAAYDFILNDNINKNITGEIYLAKEFTDDEIEIFENKFGNGIFNPESSFHITFITVPINDVVINATSDTLGAGSESTISVSFTGNDVKSFRWTCSSETVEMEQHRKYVVVRAPEVVLVPEVVTITYTLTKTNGYVFTKTVDITLISCNFYVDGTPIGEVLVNAYTPVGHDASGQFVVSSIPALDNWTIESFVGNGITSSIDQKTVSYSIASPEIGRTYTGTLNIKQLSYTYQYVINIKVNEKTVSVDGPDYIEVTPNDGSSVEYVFTTVPEYTPTHAYAWVETQEGETLSTYTATIKPDYSGFTLNVPASTEGDTNLVLKYFINDDNSIRIDGQLPITVSSTKFDGSITVDYEISENSNKLYLYQDKGLFSKYTIIASSYEKNIPDIQTEDITVPDTTTVKAAYITISGDYGGIRIKYDVKKKDSYDLSNLFAGCRSVVNVVVNKLNNITSMAGMLNNFVHENSGSLDEGVEESVYNQENKYVDISFKECTTAETCDMAYFAYNRNFKDLDFRGISMSGLYGFGSTSFIKSSASIPATIYFHEVVNCNEVITSSCLSDQQEGYYNSILWTDKTYSLLFSGNLKWICTRGGSPVIGTPDISKGRCLVFIADTATTLKINKSVSMSSFNIQYCQNNGSQGITNDIPKQFPMNAGDYIQLCVPYNGLQNWYQGSSYYAYFQLTTGRIRCLGNISAITRNGTPDFNSSNAFKDLFKNCTALVEAPQIPYTSTGAYSYENMFSGCTKLKWATKYLLADVVNSYAYKKMFNSCSLIKLPECPNITTVNSSSFDNAFYNASNTNTRTSFNILPDDTTINVRGTGAFSSAYQGCVNIIAPKKLNIDATSLSDSLSCFNSMFMSMRGKFIAPESITSDYIGTLFAYKMFYDCNTMKKGPKILPSGKISKQCFSYMFFGCSEMTEGPELINITDADLGNSTILEVGISSCSYMFAGCTKLKKAPKFNSVKIEKAFVQTFEYMFKDCTDLTIDYGYKLPGCWAGTGCFRGMFMNCVNINSVPDMTDIIKYRVVGNSGDGIYPPFGYMFSGCENIQWEGSVISYDVGSEYYSPLFNDTFFMNSSSGVSINPFDHMFDRCYNICNTGTMMALPISGYDVNITFTDMFVECQAVNIVLVFDRYNNTDFNIDKSNYFTSMFNNCGIFEFDIEFKSNSDKMTVTNDVMSNMFTGSILQKLTIVYNPGYFDNITIPAGLFKNLTTGCTVSGPIYAKFQHIANSSSLENWMEGAMENTDTFYINSVADWYDVSSERGANTVPQSMNIEMIDY